MASEIYKGVELSSRHELAHEIAKMREIIDGIGPLSSRVESMWCDSKAESTYSVTIRDGKWHDDLRRAFADSAFAAGGHNGIYVEADGGHGFTLDPDWPGDREEIELMDAVEEVEAARLNQPHKEVIPKGFLDRLRTAIPLSEVVGRSTKWDLRKSNMSKGDYWAACPFHEDVGTGLHVDDQKGFYYCFGCHAKGDIVTFVKERDNVSFIQSVRRLAFIAGMDHELLPATPEPPTILQLKDVIVRTFSKENFLEVGILTGWSNYIRTHDRLLRSLSWNDPDYAGNVLEMLGAMETKKDGSLEKVQAYVSTTFPEQAHIVTQTAAFSASKSVLGYQYVTPRDLSPVFPPGMGRVLG